MLWFFSVIYIVLLTLEIIGVPFGIVSLSFFKDVSIVVLLLVDLFAILILVISIYFFLVVPNRSRKIIDTDCVNLTAVQVSSEKKF